MQVSSLVVERIKINVMDDLATLCSGNLAVFPFPAGSLRSVSQAVIRPGQSFMKSVSAFNRCISTGGERENLGNRTDHFVSPSHVRSVGGTTDLLLVRVQRVSVSLEHLIVAIAKFLRHRRTFAMSACATDHSAAPTVISSSVTPHSFVVHEAKSVRCVCPPASVDRATAIGDMISHRHIVSGNREVNKAVPVVRWIGERIEKFIAARKAVSDV